ncbi:MAG: hypothetical protein FWD93_06450 [Coriobacteriia bacterium]|nr:hypothetical protein [Coriobacteriia bacterium]
MALRNVIGERSLELAKAQVDIANLSLKLKITEADFASYYGSDGKRICPHTGPHKHLFCKSRKWCPVWQDERWQEAKSQAKRPINPRGF